MIVTRKKHIPLHWILLVAVPWGAGTWMAYAPGTAFLFSLRKFVDNPVGLTFILTLPSYISLFLAPVCSFLSDRIWTRFGRRKPFVLISWLGMMTALVLMPLMPNLWSLIVLYMLFSMSVDVGGPLEPLAKEIVPPHQRGRATGAMQWMMNGANLVFYFVALGRFDDVRFMSGWLISGEKLIYWSAGLLLLVTFFLLILGIKEINPKSPLAGRRLSVGIFFRALFDQDLWPVYTLAFGAAMLAAGLGPLGNLLYTDQWGYTKQDMGTNVAVGGVLNIFIIGILAMVADRLNRLRAYQVLITLFLIVQVFYYLYVEYILPDRRPSLVELIFFGETGSIIGTLTGMIYLPLVYDYVTRDKMGTYAAGAMVLKKLTTIITLNAIGFFVWGYALLYGPPAGEMARVCFTNEVSAAQVQAMVKAQTWTYPVSGGAVPDSDVRVNAWYPTGVVRDTGACWEVRLRDKKGEEIAARIQDLEDQLTPLLENKKHLDDASAIAELKNEPGAAAQARQKAQACDLLIHALEEKLNPLQAAQKNRVDGFTQQVTHAWSKSILPEGGQIVAARVQNALVVELAVQRRPGAALEKSLLDLRRLGMKVIDLRRTQHQENYGVAVSALLDGPGGEEALLAKLTKVTTDVLGKREPGLFFSPTRVVAHWTQQAVVLDLKVVGDPLDNQISPITRVVNGLLALIDSAPQPEHRLAGTARSLRINNETEHVGIEPVPGHGKTISVVTLLLSQAPRSSVHDAITQRLQSLFGTTATEDTVAQTRAFYDRLVDAAAVQRIAIEEPMLAADYAPLKYDYMSGYIAMFFLAAIGLAITFAFARREKRGLIRKLGVEEAEGVQAASSSLGHISLDALREAEPSEQKVVYTPGGAGWKLGVIAVGMAIFLYGFGELWTPLDLLFDGARATAQVVRVIKTKPGLPDQVFTDDLHLDAAREQNDRSYIFWDEFRFTASNGMGHTVRLPIGSQLRPLFPLLDDDGLPTTATVCYLPGNPGEICIPSVMSTWFAPGVITFMGLLCLLIGGMLLHAARRPIEIP